MPDFATWEFKRLDPNAGPTNEAFQILLTTAVNRGQFNVARELLQDFCMLRRPFNPNGERLPENFLVNSITFLRDAGMRRKQCSLVSAAVDFSEWLLDIDGGHQRDTALHTSFAAALDEIGERDNAIEHLLWAVAPNRFGHKSASLHKLLRSFTDPRGARNPHSPNYGTVHPKRRLRIYGAGD